MKASNIAIRFALLVLFAGAAASGCGGCDADETGNNTVFDGGLNAADGSTTNGANNGSFGDAGGPPQDASSPFFVNDAGMVDCGGEPCACDNGIDDDGDGLIDGFDPECTGPYDNDESSFATGISGDNRDPKWQDCFFDGNSGAGDDKCRYHTDCLTGALPADDPDCQVSQQCFDFCRPLTPNGCDCFGCCEVYADDGEKHFIVIGGTCSIAKLGTPECQVCEQTDSCINTCGRCELCVGKERSDLPADCFESGGSDAGGQPDAGGGGSPGPTCDDGEATCSSSSECGNNQYCQLGCCVQVVL